MLDSVYILRCLGVAINMCKALVGHDLHWTQGHTSLLSTQKHPSDTIQLLGCTWWLILISRVYLQFITKFTLLALLVVATYPLTKWDWLPNNTPWTYVFC